MTRFENRVRLAKMTKAERKKECPVGLKGLARQRYIEHGLSLADQIHMAAVTRIAAEESQEDTMQNATSSTDGFTIKAAAKELGISRKTVKAFAEALELSKPFSAADMERLAARKLARTQPDAPTEEPRYIVVPVSVGAAGLTQRPSVYDRKEDTTVKVYRKNQQKTADEHALRLNEQALAQDAPVAPEPAAPAKTTKGKLTPAQVAEQLSITPFEVRRAARAAKLTKQGKGWSFGKRDVAAISKQLAA